MSEYGSRPPQQPSGWAIGGLTFAGCALAIIGGFQMIAGLAAIIDDEFFVVVRHYAFHMDTTTWGWIELIIGICVLATGFGLLGARPWAAVVAIVLCSLSAIANFFFIPYYPFWAILVIAIDIWVIWSITRPGVIET